MDRGFAPRFRVRSARRIRARNALDHERHRSKSARLGERCDSRIIVPERFAQDLLCVLTQQRRGDGIDGRGQAHIERRFDIGH